MDEFRALLGRIRVLPVVTLDDAAHAPPLAEALSGGGLPCVEVTLRTAAALDAIRLLAREPSLLVGAGTVLSAPQARAAIDAGARFVVSPGFSAGVLRACRAAGVPALPGVATPTDLIRALDAGLDTVKLFPAATLGGPAAARVLAGPFPAVRLVPTGGVTAAGLRGYLAVPTVLAVGGSWMAPPALVRAGRFDEIRRLADQTVTIVSEATDAPATR